MASSLLAVAFLGNDQTGEIHVALVEPSTDGSGYSFSNVNGFGTGLRVPEILRDNTGGQCFGMQFFRGRFYLAYTDASNNLVVCSSLDGKSWTKCADIPEDREVHSSPYIRSMVVFKKKLWVAVRTAFDRLVLYSSSDGKSWSRGSQTDKSVNISSVGMAVFNERIWVAVSHPAHGTLSPTPQKIDILSTSDANEWSDLTRVGGETTTAGISLAAYKNALYLAFIASNASNSILLCTSTDGKQWSGNTRVGQESSTSAPSLVATESRGLSLFFQANDEGRELLACWSQDGANWSPNGRLGQESCKRAPAATATVAQSASVDLPYLVLGLVYAPPGTKGGSKSNVQYSSSNTVGSKVTIGSSFKDDVNVGFSLGTKALGLTPDFTVSFASDIKDSVEIKKSYSTTFTLNGPTIDGVDHGEDLFHIWLNPQINITREESGLTLWNLGAYDTLSMIIQNATVNQLKGLAPLPESLSKLTNEDKNNILRLSPFASSDGEVDPNRFSRLNIPIAYQPASGEGGGSTTKYDLSRTTTESHLTSYSVGNTFKLSVGLEDIGLKASNSIQVSQSTMTEDTEASGQTASLTISNPSKDYTGPTVLEVYWDNLFSVFMFKLTKI